MFRSHKAQEMYSSVSPIYENNEVMKKIFEVLGEELDKNIKLTDDILEQFFPQTATWGLIIWEKRLNISSNINENIDIRRAKVLSRLQSKNKIINPKQMALIISNYTKAKINIVENVEPYIFEINLISFNGFSDFLKNMYDEVMRVKPSHLGVRYKLTAITQSEVFVGVISFTGESITTYPWTPSKIESKTNFYVPIIQYSGLENITTYPKEG